MLAGVCSENPVDRDLRFTIREQRKSILKTKEAPVEAAHRQDVEQCFALCDCTKLRTSSQSFHLVHRHRRAQV